MPSNPLFYKEVIPLDRNHHETLFLTPRADYRYATGTNSVFLTISEFGRACHEYPIVFADDGQNVFPLAILGLRDGENLFVTAAGEWNATYVPAYVRRYPFILSNHPESDSLTVCIDRSYSNINNERKGFALFENGKESAFLNESLNFLKDFQTQYALTIQVSSHLKELGILESMQANVELTTGSKLNMGGFFVVNRKRLTELPADKLAELVRNGILELIYLHFNSLENFARLVERLANQPIKNLADTQTVGNA